MQVDAVQESSTVATVDATGKGILYLCPTPIGNLEDMTFRSIKVLEAVDYIGAEDTRHTGRLLQHFSIQKPLISYHEHNKEDKGNYIISLLEEGKSVAIVSDAGMPAISDPGADIVQKAIPLGIEIVPLPGANAALTGLIASGLDTTEFTFMGFLPKRKPNRVEVLERIKEYRGTLIFYEAPHRIEEVLKQMYDVLGDRPCAIGRELTKKFETFTRTTLGKLVGGEEELTIRGEFVIMLAGYDGELTEKETLITDPVAFVQDKIEKGMPKKEAIKEVAKQLGLAKRDVYNAVEAAREDV